MSRSEVFVAQAVLSWLSEQGWDCYSEVTLPTGQDRIDIVGVRDIHARDRQVAIVECKAELSFELLAQADRGRLYADFVWVAVPKLMTKSVGRHEAVRIASHFYNFGVLEVDAEVEQRKVPGPLYPRCRDRLLDVLRPEHKTYAAAGSKGGGQFTDFKASAAKIAAFVKENEGCTLVEAVDGVGWQNTHYRSRVSALGALRVWIDRGKVPGVFPGWKGRLWSSAEAMAVFPARKEQSA